MVCRAKWEVPATRFSRITDVLETLIGERLDICTVIQEPGPPGSFRFGPLNRENLPDRLNTGMDDQLTSAAAIEAIKEAEARGDDLAASRLMVALQAALLIEDARALLTQITSQTNAS
ncbi:hypothetical protein GCM10011349_38980 [Novosphingobium indicum]|uniref:Uncharacterized protein n=2 Tax=Novosphingobium indicum TaxID=462949 RepID=A0ABQ2JYJ8_9SPHN|nr:hypothetical protein GCM10011349_38980 [Novosphingobium indicum]